MDIHAAYKVIPARHRTVICGDSCRWEPVFASTNKWLTYWVGRLLGARRFCIEGAIRTENVDDDEYKTEMVDGKFVLIHQKID